MTSDSDSELSQALDDSVTLFTLAKAQSIASSGPAPAKHTRNIARRKGIVPPKTPQRRAKAARLTQEDTGTLTTIPIHDAERPDALESSDEEEAFTLLHTPGPGSSISQSSSLIPIKRSRPLISGVWEHCTRENRFNGEVFQCNHCKKVYKVSGGTHSIRKHLKDSHRIDPLASSVALKRQQDGRTIDAVILRGNETSLLKEEVRRNELMAIQINKTTLEYLYIAWIVTDDIPFHQVTHCHGVGAEDKG